MFAISALTGEGCASCARPSWAHLDRHARAAGRGAGTRRSVRAGRARRRARAQRRPSPCRDAEMARPRHSFPTHSAWSSRWARSLVTNEGRGLDDAAIRTGARRSPQLRAQGKEVVLVSSGAIAEGMQRLGWTAPPQRDARTAGRGRRRPDGTGPGLRILLPRARPADRAGAAHPRGPGRPQALPECALDAAARCCELGVVPIINENDTVVTDEIKFGDNDTLGALVANLIDADALVILTDQHGLYTADPRKDPAATLLSQRARRRRRRWKRWPAARAARSARGGMITKVLAAKRAAQQRRAHGRSPAGASRTCWCAWPAARRSARSSSPRQPRLAARKQWLADHLQLRGAVTLDAGAVSALQRDGKSLLPIGVIEVAGRIRARRGGRLPRPRRPRDRARADQLRQLGEPAASCARPRPRSNRCSVSSTSPN